MIKQERVEAVAKSIMRPVEIFAEDAAKYYDNPNWMTTPKLNGVFARWDPVRRGFFSKRGIRFNEHLIPHLYNKYASLSASYFDGEIWAPHLTLQQICGALAHERDEPASYYKHLLYVPFDIPYHGSSTWTDRWLILNDHPEITIAALMFGNSAITKENCDGEVYRFRRGIYQAGESGNVLKYKFWKDTEGEVIDKLSGTPGSTFHGVLGALVVRFGDKLVSVGSGYTHEERVEFIENPPKSIKFKYLSISPDGIPLNPVYIGLDI